MPTRVCAIDGCLKSHKSKGFCKVHYSQYAIRKICEVKDCGRYIHARNLCKNHYKRKLRGAPMESPVPSGLSQYQTLRSKVLDMLGNKCCRCGISDIRVLQIDHIFGGGRYHREALNGSWSSIARGIIRGFYPGIFQILCANCHRIKTIENKEQSGRPKKQ